MSAGAAAPAEGPTALQELFGRVSESVGQAIGEAAIATSQWVLDKIGSVANAIASSATAGINEAEEEAKAASEEAPSAVSKLGETIEIPRVPAPAAGTRTPGPNTVRAGDLARESGLYSTDRHKKAVTAAKEGQSTFLDGIPGVGFVKGLFEFWTGRDEIVGKDLGTGERVLGGLGAIGPLGIVADGAQTLGRGAKRVGKLGPKGPAGAFGRNSLGSAGALPRNVSRISESPKLVRSAKEAGKSVQSSIDKLTHELSRGNLNPGTGTKPIGRGISEARARDGARVYFRQLADGTIEILGKSNKANQSAVIEEVLRLFGT